MSSDNSIFKRNSSVNFISKELGEDSLEKIINAAIWAPSSRNGQPWRIIGLKHGTTNFNKIIEASSEGNQKWASKAGIILAFCTNKFDGELNPKTFLDIGFSGQNAMLQATELGLETHPYGGWNEDLVKKVLNIPSNAKVAFLLAIGYPGTFQNKKNRERNKLELNFSFDEWNERF